MKNNKYIIIGFLLITFLLPKTVFGIGQVTKPIVVDNALRGQEVTAKLSFINSKDTELIYGLMAEGEIAEWTTFFTIDDLNFENSITEIKINPAITQNAIVKFTVPNDQPNGTYAGKVYVFEVAKTEEEAEKTKINVGQRIGRSVSITVSEKEVIKLESVIIPLTYTVNKGEPLQIKFIHANQGNVAVKPSYQIRVTKEGKEIFNAIFPYPESEKAIKPLERKTMPLVEWQTTGLEDGMYMFEIKVLLNDEIVKKINHGLTVGNYNKLLAMINPGDMFSGLSGIFGNGIIKFISIGIIALFSIILFIKYTNYGKYVKKLKFKKTNTSLNSDKI